MRTAAASNWHGVPGTWQLLAVGRIDRRGVRMYHLASSRRTRRGRDPVAWDWADADTSLVVVIEQTGTVSITHGPDSQGRQSCD
jgi:hypothetical protein